VASHGKRTTYITRKKMDEVEMSVSDDYYHSVLLFIYCYPSPQAYHRVTTREAPLQLSIPADVEASQLAAIDLVCCDLCNVEKRFACPSTADM